MKTWIFNPHTGGVKISPAKQLEVRQRIERHAASNYAGRYSRLGIRFRGALCYIDAFTEPEPPIPSLLKTTGETKASSTSNDYAPFQLTWVDCDILVVIAGVMLSVVTL
jgi:hypothetical protein